MDIDFLGVGWSYPCKLDERGQVLMVKYEDCVRQSILAILSTARGERVMRPDFGCRIHDLVFAPNNAGTVGEVISDVRSALVDWEPRIDILDIDVLPNPAHPNLLQISINYQVRTTNNQFNLVYPFYLQ
ncbi:GPW/gp25 family protein [Dolichospermum sp. ST_sed1]|nr:GPW/gp25 family protein [Dolichospermum sp. DET66]MBS3034230.1 GPW/gp25 family protein [Dolichospermum sp. DET67]MBS3039433.1 GPW/gp25 family protein [Dolichospermum sp. DET50]MDD1417708.1 GPW/gp25 family protein [Dolichospermum sp. ST_sed1]MDD1424539.1 GPW/gp25 family protein [Dolichospermum sp. ST_sed9]MDD1432239.1 GPW/gp25 family protein [Dolichospermum sp. ST_sed6]MDD1440273.1 GPW/gp25 family protein [Dolichospermum sp. ST_sed3]MDD1445755.1 GPW/gp25 family protein [Dolichospermum sp. 